MEETINKTKFRIQSCTNRRLSIQHEFDEHLRKQNHLSNLHFYKYQEELFNRKMNHLRKNLEHIEPYVTDDINDEEALMTPNCFTRIQNHFRLLNFSSDTEKRLLCQAPSYNKSNKQISNQLPNISQKRNSNEINQCIRRVSFYQSRPPKPIHVDQQAIIIFENQIFLNKKIFNHILINKYLMNKKSK